MELSSSNFSQRFRFFSRHTTFHGFREVAEARRWFQKLVWITIMFGSVALLAYSLRRQVNRYLSDPMMTRISLLSEDEPYKHPEVWFELDGRMWMDMDTIARFNLTSEDIQFAMGFFSPNITLESNKNLTDIELSFDDSMDRMNASGLRRFVSLLALDKFDDTTEWRFLLKSTSTKGSCYFCVDLSSARKQNYSQTFQAAMRFDFARYYENAERLFGFFEPHQTIGQPKNVSTKAVSGLEKPIWMNPTFFNIDTNQMIRLNPGVLLSITIDSKLYRQLRNCRQEKEFEEDLMYYKYVCEVDCEIGTNMSFGQSCVQLNETGLGAYFSRSFRDGTVNACHLGLWINGSLIGGEKPIWKDEINEHDRKEALRKCRERCLPECERTSTLWATHVSPLSSITGVDDGSNVMQSEVWIDFPDRSTLIIFEEVVQYDWNDMVSDLGGLLGLWLGASMMSLFQVVHLCCWVDGDKSEK